MNIPEAILLASAIEMYYNFDQLLRKSGDFFTYYIKRARSKNCKLILVAREYDDLKRCPAAFHVLNSIDTISALRQGAESCEMLREDFGLKDEERAFLRVDGGSCGEGLLIQNRQVLPFQMHIERNTRLWQLLE